MARSRRRTLRRWGWLSGAMIACLGSSLLVPATYAGGQPVPPTPMVAAPVGQAPMAWPAPGYAPVSDIDPFCGTCMGHPCAKPTNGYDNQRIQWMRQWFDHHRLPRPYYGDAWLDRYQGGGSVPAPTAASPFGF